MIKTYKVTWTIDICAESPKDAAWQARYVQMYPDSTATVFDVDGTEIDLEDKETVNV